MKLTLLVIIAFFSYSSLANDLTDAEKCKKNGGRYTATGFQRSSCIMPLADGGKKCMNSKQCLGYCEAIPEVDEEKKANPDPKIKKQKNIWKQYGQCSKDNSPSNFSCRSHYENGIVDPVICQ